MYLLHDKPFKEDNMTTFCTKCGLPRQVESYVKYYGLPGYKCDNCKTYNKYPGDMWKGMNDNG